MTASPHTKQNPNPKILYPKHEMHKNIPIILKGYNISPQPQATSPRDFGSAACPNNYGWHFEVKAKVMFLAL